MKKHQLILLTACCIGVNACCNVEVEPEVPNPDMPTITEGAYVLNQGNYGLQIEGSISLLDYNNTTAQQNLFQRANGRSLGATPQGAIVYGSKIYVAVYESNTIEIINRTDYKYVKQISLENEKGQSPRALVAKDGKVYVSMFNGFVSRLDTLSLSIDKTVEVGPNPEIMAIRDNYLYVPNSDGMNWQVGYGTTASKINLSTFTVEKTFNVGLNPAEFATNGTDLFLLCKGNYNDIMSTIYRIDANDESTKIAEATMMAVKGDNLYYIDAPYWATEFTYEVYDLTTGKTAKMINDGGVDSPAGLAVDPINGNIVITSYNLDNGWASYTTDGYAKLYDNNGNLLCKYVVGVGPVAIFFNNK